MQNNSAVVVAIDGLRASAFGAYGNTWFETPHVDRLAAESTLWEWCFANTTELLDAYRGLWQGIHPLRAADYADGRQSLAAAAAAAGVRTCLITDEPAVANFVVANEFDERICQVHQSSKPCDDVADTAIGRLFAAASDKLFELCDESGPDGRTTPFLLWLHSRGMYGPWDAPIAWREEYREAGDPEPYAGVTTPTAIPVDSNNPDSWFPYSASHAAQTRVLDACVGALLHTLAELPLQRGDGRLPADLQILLVGVRGFALGEHGQVGGCDTRLPIEQLHVPLIVRLPSGLGRLTREQRLVEHADVASTLSSCLSTGEDWLADRDGRVLRPTSLVKENWRDHVVARSPDGSRAIRTADWSLRMPAGGGDASHELYARPDDLWEANDVAGLCPEIIQDLTIAIDAFHTRVSGGEVLDAPALPDHLAENAD